MKPAKYITFRGAKYVLAEDYSNYGMGTTFKNIARYLDGVGTEIRRLEQDLTGIASYAPAVNAQADNWAKEGHDSAAAKALMDDILEVVQTTGAALKGVDDVRLRELYNKAKALQKVGDEQDRASYEATRRK